MIGKNTIIEDGVIIGSGVHIGRCVVLKKGTVVMDNVYIDDYVVSSGDNLIMSGAALRYGVILARRLIVGPEAFLSPRVSTIGSLPGEYTVIGQKVFIGTGAVIDAGVRIAPRCKVGALSYVRHDCSCPGATYIGVPAKILGGCNG